jgi:hypothetical protein
MAPFVASLDKLAAVQEGMDRKHARDRGQEDKWASLEMDQLEQKRKFEQMCELSDGRECNFLTVKQKILPYSKASTTRR